MRIAVISDIHGNQIALEAVLQDLAQQPKVDQLVIAGDLCLNGPCPRQVLETLQRLHCPVIQGNVDLEVVTHAAEKSERKRSTVGWTREQIGQEGIDYLASLPFSYCVANPSGSDLLIVHANPLNLEDAIFPNAPDSTLEHFLGGLGLDIGGLPRDEDLRAAYGILTWKDSLWAAEIRRVVYDVKAVIKQIKTCGMPNVEKRIKTLTEARY